MSLKCLYVSVNVDSLRPVGVFEFYPCASFIDLLTVEKLKINTICF